MTNFTVLTDEQAAHDEDATERYLEALRELQAENARLRAHIQEAAKKANAAFLARDTVANKRLALDLHKWHLAALGETK